MGESQPADLAATVAASVLELTSEIERMGLDFVVEATPAPLEGDRLLIERLVANLITNAVRHNIVDGRVEIASGLKEDRAVLSVTNTGPFIAPGEVDRLFRPFQRLDPRRANHQDGHGLGLSIVRAIASVHGADIVAESLPEGGLSVSVTFAAHTRLQTS